MTKHFEHLWEEAELVAKQHYGDSFYNNKLIFDIKKLSNDSFNTQEEKLGKIIFDICYLSQKYNINAYKALRVAIDDIKLEELDEEVKLEAL